MKQIAIFSFIAVLLLGVGCILPPEIEAEPDASEEEEYNYPPRIVPSSVSPAEAVLKMGPNCELIVFDIGKIEEKNLEDTLEVRWFVNYSQSDSATGVAMIGDIEPSPSTIRNGISFTFSRALLEADRSTYVLEVVVADRPFSKDQTREPINRAFDPDVKEVVGTDYYSWTIMVTEEDKCGM